MENHTPSLEPAVKRLADAYRSAGVPVTDPLRGGERVEIPAAFVRAMLRFDSASRDEAKQLLRKVVDLQRPSGAWLEYAYAEAETKRGYEGTIPTCFAMFALLEGHRVSNDSAHLETAQRGIEFLLRHERGGYFYKASFNKSDVVNTNLLAGLALRSFGTQVADSGSIAAPLAHAANRSVLRSVRSQLGSGAFPYISFGTKVPYLYHAMSTALIGLHAAYVPEPVTLHSFERGVAYLRRIIGADGMFVWKHANLKDKEGAVWAYAWAALCFALAGDERNTDRMVAQLERLRGTQFLRNGDFDERDDLFYTSWVLFALSFIPGIRPLPQSGRSLTTRARHFALRASALVPRTRYMSRILHRKLGIDPLDQGPAEEH